MLLIGDIHIHPRHSDGIIEMLRSYISTHDEEKTIVFVGDYVFHFSYHRASLLALLDFFIQLTQEGKTVYVLAGNHDRLGQHFAYAEAEKIIQIGSKNIIPDRQGLIYFITNPSILTIESESVFFLPYVLDWKDSEELNTYISQEIQQRKKTQTDTNSKLTIIHHYYVAETAFPGLKVRFTYRDLALSPHYLEDKRLRLVSGHIHHVFSYKNYLCIGAVRSTSPQETNQLQYLFQYNITTGEIHATQVQYKTYLQINNTDVHINQESIILFWKSLQDHHMQNLQSGWCPVVVSSCDCDIAKISLSLLTNTLEYNNLQNHIDEGLMQSLADIKIKRSYESSDMLISQLIDQTQDFASGRGDRRQLLDDYLEQKFGERKETYEIMLKSIGI